jgi:hypothetical protein
MPCIWSASSAYSLNMILVCVSWSPGNHVNT